MKSLVCNTGQNSIILPRWVSSAICITMVHICPALVMGLLTPFQWPSKFAILHMPLPHERYLLWALVQVRAEYLMRKTAMKPALQTSPRGNALTGPSCTAGRREFMGHSIVRHALSMSRSISVEEHPMRSKRNRVSLSFREVVPLWTCTSRTPCRSCSNHPWMATESCFRRRPFLLLYGYNFAN